MQKRELWIALAIFGAAFFLVPAEIRVWVDQHGVTHASNDPSRTPRGAVGPDRVRELWGDEVLGEPLRPEPGATSSEEDRVLRSLRDAVTDLQRGDTAVAVARLEDVLRLDPNRPEAHFHLAMLEGRRGHLDAAEAHLRAFLSAAGEGFDDWRASAQRRLDQLEDERRLMTTPAAKELRLVALAHPAFAIQADSALLEAGGADFASTVGGMLDDARATLAAALGGAVPAEPLGVVLYGKANYLQANAQRFSFQTVGFFDGRIHVISAAHPGGELRGLLVHEYTHALFHERTGGDRPYWLNEGLAELFERSALQRAPLSRTEAAQLRGALGSGSWIPLRRLAPSFTGLSDLEARLAYAESAAAADWLVRHSEASARARLLERIGAGVDFDTALREAVRVDAAGLEAALQRELDASSVAGIY